MLWLTSLLLLVNAIFSFVVWPPFLRRIRADPRSHDTSGAPTRFLTVHLVLIRTALALAVVTAAGGIWGIISAIAA